MAMIQRVDTVQHAIQATPSAQENVRREDHFNLIASNFSEIVVLFASVVSLFLRENVRRLTLCAELQTQQQEHAHPAILAIKLL